MSSLKHIIGYFVAGCRNRNAANIIIRSVSGCAVASVASSSSVVSKNRRKILLLHSSEDRGGTYWNVSALSSSSDSGVKCCWNCGTPSASDTNKFFKCSKCDKLQPIPKGNIDFFRLFNITERFELDPSDLSKKFRQFQSQVHPDKFAGKDEREKDNSISWSTLLNKAYKILSAPLSRGEYLLRNYQSESAAISAESTVKSKEFLMEMMEKNEEVDEAETKSELEKLLQITDDDINKMLEELRMAFDNKDFRNAKDILEKMKFLYSLKNGIKLKLENMLSE